MQEKMKCRYCGASINLTDEVCPSCEAVNPTGRKYKKDEQKYRSQLDNADKELGEQKLYIARMFIRSVVVLILIITFVVMLSRIIYKGSLKYETKNLNDRYGAITQKLDYYWNDEDYYSFYSYADRTGVAGWTGGKYNSYQPQIKAAHMYIFINDYLAEYLASDNVYDRNDALTHMCGLLTEFYDVNNLHYTNGVYTGSQDSDEKITQIHNYMGEMLKTYFYINDEEAEDVKTMDDNQIQILLEDSVERHDAEESHNE